MYIATIKCYTPADAGTSGFTFELQIPGRVTITGDEDHWGRATDDVEVALSALRAADRAKAKKARPDEEVDINSHLHLPRYWGGEPGQGLTPAGYGQANGPETGRIAFRPLGRPLSDSDTARVGRRRGGESASVEGRKARRSQ